VAAQQEPPLARPLLGYLPSLGVSPGCNLSESGDLRIFLSLFFSPYPFLAGLFYSESFFLTKMKE